MANEGKSFSDLLREINEASSTGSLPDIGLPSIINKIDGELKREELLQEPLSDDLFNGLSLDSFVAKSEQEPSEPTEVDPSYDFEIQSKGGFGVLPAIEHDLSPTEGAVTSDVESSQTEVKSEPTKREKVSYEVSKSNPVVTPDGRTIEEMLINMRGGATKLDDTLSKYKKGLKRTKVNGVVKPDDRYTKHAKSIEREVSRDEARIKASKKFIQKNSRYTEEEKVIMRNLGLNPEEFAHMLSKKSGLSEEDKAKLISSGRAGAARHFAGKRFRATVGDLDLVHFLAKFKFCNTKILSRLRNEPQSRTWRKLTRLKNGGLVTDSEVIGMGTVWYLTEAGMALSGYDFPTLRSRFPKTSAMPPVIGANHVAACLWNNSFNILMLDDFPASEKTVEKAGVPTRIPGETLISELEVRSSLGREAKPSFGSGPSRLGNMYNEVGERARALWHEWDSRGRVDSSPEFEIGNEFMWVLYPESGLTKSYHVPDLVIARDRNADGSPRSIAVEVELNPKSDERYVQTLMAYKLDKHIYESVVWVTNSTSITRKLIKIAEDIGLENFDVVPMTNENGIYKNRDIWHI